MFGRKPRLVEISAAAYQELTARLIENGVDFKVVDGAIDLSGVAIVREEEHEPQLAQQPGIAGHRPLSNVSVKIDRKSKAR